VPPLGGAARCSKCHWAIIPDGSARIWCPHCGADLKLVFDEAKPEVPAGDAGPRGAAAVPAPGGAAAARAPAGERQQATRPAPPSYFHGRTECRYRVYVLPDELLFLEAPDLCDPRGTEN